MKTTNSLSCKYWFHDNWIRYGMMRDYDFEANVTNFSWRTGWSTVPSLKWSVSAFRCRKIALLRTRSQLQLYWVRSTICIVLHTRSSGQYRKMLICSIWTLPFRSNESWASSFQYQQRNHRYWWKWRSHCSWNCELKDG